MTLKHCAAALLFLLVACDAPGAGSEVDAFEPSKPATAEDDAPASTGDKEPAIDDNVFTPSPETTGGDETTNHTEGMPEMTKVVYFGVPNFGFPTYLAHLIGAKFHLFPTVVITNPSATKQRVVLRGALQGYTKSAAVATIDLEPGETKTGHFDATLDFAALGAVKGQVNATYNISLETTEGKVLNARTKTMAILPKNTVLWKGIFNNSTGAAEKEAVVGALTTPHDAKLSVDGLLKEAAPRSKFKAMLGYQYHKSTSTVDDDAAGANDQVGAIYETLRARGFNYTSVSEAFFSGAQNIRYPSESLSVATANCIDGALVFASALEALDMDPFIVFVPGHAFVGVHIAPAGTPNYSKILFVETTMLGTADYVAASLRGRDEWRQHTAAKTALPIDVKAMRKKGYLPNPLM